METKATRPPNDPLVNPQPGDVVKMRAGWTRKVVGKDADVIRFTADCDFLEDNSYEFCLSLSSWISSSQNAEVLNVA